MPSKSAHSKHSPLLMGANLQAPANAAILKLPVELIHLICNDLSLAWRASLSLTCRRLYAIIGKGIWHELNDFPPSFKTRTAKSFLLRALERDLDDPSVYLCYNCLRFHQIKDPSPPQPRYLRDLKYLSSIENQVGFPYCRTEYTQAIQEIYARVETPRADQGEPLSFLGHINTPTHLHYCITCGLGPRDLFLLRKFTLTVRVRPRTYFMVPSYNLRQMNLGICRHVSFGHDHVLGDGSINDALHKYYHKQHDDYCMSISSGQSWQPEPFTGYVCQTCKLEVEIRFAGFNVTIFVWQYIGSFKKHNSSIWRKVTKLLPISTSLRSSDFATRVKRNGGLKAGDLKREWDALDHLDKGNVNL